MPDGNSIAVLTSSALLFLTRPELRRPPPKEKHKPTAVAEVFDDEERSPLRPKKARRADKELEAKAAAEAAAAAEVPFEPFYQFQFTSILRLTNASSPKILKQFPDRILAIAGAQGVQMIQYEAKHLQHSHDLITLEASISSTDNDTTLPSLLLANVPIEGVRAVVANTCSHTFGSSSYLAEMLVISADFRISLYGLRNTDRRYAPLQAKQIFDEESLESAPREQYFEEVDVGASPYLAEADLIAEYQFKDTPTHFPGKATPAKLMECMRVVPMEMGVSGKEAVSRQLICTFGGMISILELIQPHNTIVHMKNSKNKSILREEATDMQLSRMIKAVARGPDMYSFESLAHSTSPDEDPTYPTVLLMRDNYIDLIAGTTGKVLQTLSLQHVLSTATMGTDPLRFNGSVSSDKHMLTYEQDIEGVATAFHWCPYTQLVVVGYSTGAVGMIGFQQPIHTSCAPDFTYIRSNELHGEITLLRTFRFTQYAHLIDDPLHPEQGKDLTVLLIGDAQGTISLWQMSPLRHGKPLLSSIHQHQGSIINASICSVPAGLIKEPVPTDTYTHFNTANSFAKDTNHQILVTVCSKGLVVAWRVEKNLSLDMLAFFHSPHPHKLSSSIIFPKMVYRKLLVPKPADKKEETMSVATLYYEIYCILGFADGTLEAWNLSSDTRYASSEPIFSMKQLDRPLTSLLSCRTDDTSKVSHAASAAHIFLPNSISNEFTLVNHPQDFLWDADQSPYPNSSTENILCGHANGTVFVMEIKFNPLYSLDDHDTQRLVVRRLNYFHLPYRLQALLPGRCHSLNLQSMPRSKYAGHSQQVSVWDYFLVGDFEVHDFLPWVSISKAVPAKWHRCQAIASNKAASRPGSRLGTPSARMIQNESGTKIDVMDEYSNRSQSIENECSESSYTGYSLDGMSLASRSSANSLRKDKRQYIGPMESMQRIVSSDLYIAKKDKRLLELFTQQADAASMSANQAMSIVITWCNEQQQDIHLENLQELFKLLDIQPEERLKFVEVAKIAAITISAVKKGAEMTHKAAAKVKKVYKTMRNVKTKVSYNSMGERVVEKIPLTEDTMGLPTGTLTVVKNGLAAFLDRHRSEIQLLKTIPAPSTAARLLQSIPSALQAQIGKLPVSTDRWSVDHLHYFDEARTLSIARTLLDMRCSSQYEVMQSLDIFKAGTAQVVGMPKLLVKHFERLFGECAATMNVSRHKIANYLEACLQYAYYPLLNVLKSMLCLDQTTLTFPSAEVANWLVAEARSMLISRGHTSNSTDESKISWIYTTRTSAVAVCDELLRVRGQYGPHMYLDLFDTVNTLPLADLSSEELDALPAAHRTEVIDLERFLECLYFEYMRKDEQIKALQKRVFGEYSLNIASAAISREINTAEAERRAPINDELDVGFGPHHAFNLSRIQDIMKGCMRVDALRTGVVSKDVLQDRIREVLFDTMRSEDRGRSGDAYRLLLLAKAQTKVRSVEDQLSYIDIIAILLAWEEHQQGFVSISMPALIEALPGISRSIEAALAKDFVKYFSLLSCLDNTDDPAWVMKRYAGTAALPLHTTASQTSLQKTVPSTTQILSLPTEGNWRPAVALPSEEPGMLTIQRVDQIYSPVKEAPASAVPLYEQHRREMQALPVPKVLETDRPRITLSGEVSQMFRPLGQASLALQRMDADLPAEAFAPGQELIEGRQSYSRVMHRIGVDVEVPAVSTAKMLEDELRLVILDPLPVPHVHSLGTPGKRPEGQGRTFEDSLAALESQFSDTDSSTHLLKEDSIATLDSNYQQYDLSFLGEDIVPKALLHKSDASLTPFLEARDEEMYRDSLSFDQQASLAERSLALAEAEVSRRIVELSAVEESFLGEYADEQAEFAKRQKEKEELRARLRAEMLIKEREAMKMYHASLKQRGARRDKAVKQLNAMEAAEAADRAQKEKDIQAILERNRSRALGKMAQKMTAEGLAAQREAESAENKLMRKEDAVATALENASRKAARAAEEAAIREEEAALAARIAELAAIAAASQSQGPRPKTPDDYAIFNASQRPSSPIDEDDQVADLPEVASPEKRPPMARRQSSLLHLLRESSMEESTEEVVAEEEEVPVEEEVPEEMEDDESTEAAGVLGIPNEDDLDAADLTPTERRIRLLLRNIRNALTSQRTHPRRQPGAFCTPLMFSEDIAFKAFDSATDDLVAWTRDQEPSEQDEEVKEISEEEAAQTARNPFADIDAAVRKHRRRLEEERTQMFKTAVEEIDAADWTSVVRVAGVDWAHFFKSQEAKLDLIKAMARGPDSVPPPEDFSASNPAPSLPTRERVTSFNMLRASIAIPADVLGVPKSLAVVLPTDVKASITPLPYGKVLRKQIIGGEELRFFQIEVSQEDCLLTIELRCSKGYADLYLSPTRLPSTVKHSYKISATKENGRLARLSIAPQEVGSYFAAVSAPITGAEFDLWAYGTSDTSSEILPAVSKVIDKWNLLAAHSIDELAVHFPRLEVEAKQAAEQAALDRAKGLKKRRAVLREMQLLANAGKLDEVLGRSYSNASSLSSSKMIDAEEIENMESFIVKVGRMAMRKEREDQAEVAEVRQQTAEQKEEDAHKKRMSLQGEDPNQHADLFSLPVIHRNRSLATITPIQALLAQDDSDEAAALRKLLADEAADAEEVEAAKHTPFLSTTGTVMRFEGVTNALASNGVPKKRHSMALPSIAGSISSGNSFASMDSSTSDPYADYPELRYGGDVNHLIPALSSLAPYRRETSILDTDAPSLGASDRASSKRASTMRASMRNSLRMTATMRRPTSLAALPTPSTSLTHSMSMSAVEAERENRLAALLDAKGRVKQPRVSAMSHHLVLLDPQPIAYKLTAPGTRPL